MEVSCFESFIFAVFSFLHTISFHTIKPKPTIQRMADPKNCSLVPFRRCNRMCNDCIAIKEQIAKGNAIICSGLQVLPTRCSDRDGWCQASNVAPAVSTQIMASQLVDALSGLMGNWGEDTLGLVSKAAQSPDMEELYVRSYGETRAIGSCVEGTSFRMSTKTGALPKTANGTVYCSFTLGIP